jgi:diguanylate cyclase (GGDEF)-like protein
MGAQTYRARLILYSSVLIVFLIGTLVYSYSYTRSIILEESERNLTHTVRLLQSQIETERNELLRYAGIVSDDLRIQEYMFVVVRVGSDNEPLLKLYERLFGWLPIDRRVIIGEKGNVLVGAQHQDLAAWVNKHRDRVSEKVFYFEGEHGLELVAVAPIVYQGDQLGLMAVSRTLNRAWLQQKRQNSGGHVFIEKDGKIAISTLGDTSRSDFEINGGRLHLGDETYRVNPMELPGLDESMPHMWYGVSETAIVQTLHKHGQFTSMLVVVGGLAIFAVGLMIFRNFNRPLSRLITLTEEITEGRLPVMVKSEAQNEIDVLANKFADMLQAMREKQTEIDRVHKQLEKSAITDTLTGLYNRRHLQEIFPKLRSQAQRDWRCLSVILCDLDFFKKINDQYGHLAGDHCLVHFSKLLKQHSRSNDFLYRIGGEEFMILSICKDTDGSVSIADKLRMASAESPVIYRGKNIPLTVSCGVSFSTPDDPHDTALQRLLSRADKALYQAKDEGRNRVCVYKPSVDVETPTAQQA